MSNLFNKERKYVFGGYNKNEQTRYESTSGGAFSAIVDAYCQENYVIFGAEADGLEIFHSYITDKKNLGKFRKSKYSQSKMGDCYKQCKEFLERDKYVLFSGTPCQIAGLKVFLNALKTDTSNLLTVEVVCEGVPSPLYMKKYEESLIKKFGEGIESLDYRYTGRSCLNHGKWDFQVMKTQLANKKNIIKDRWINPFWSIWLDHLISRPSCGECCFAIQERTSDITLGDLWGVHLYCPELYGNNGGASLIVANTEKGVQIVKKAQEEMYGHELLYDDAIKYQSPMRKHIDVNPKRSECMRDLQSDMTFEEINKKWTHNPTIKLLCQKYIWGNRQKILWWNIRQNIFHRRMRGNSND